jgi:hypothetical protein
VSTIDDRIDALYTLPLAEFTAARNALAKSLAGADRDRVKSLQKPTTVAWAVNLLYWRERKTFDRLRRTGQALRAAQVAALKGRPADIREATSGHREALADAVSCARQLAADSGAAPDTDALSRMLEALSVSPERPEAAGRWTEAVQPAGFEALAGITPVARSEPAARPATTHTGTPAGKASAGRAGAPAATRRDSAAEQRHREAEAARRKQAEAAVREATREVDRTATAEAHADAQVANARQQLARAEASRSAARDAATRAKQTLADAEATLAKL